MYDRKRHLAVFNGKIKTENAWDLRDKSLTTISLHFNEFSLQNVYLFPWVACQYIFISLKTSAKYCQGRKAEKFKQTTLSIYKDYRNSSFWKKNLINICSWTIIFQQNLIATNEKMGYFITNLMYNVYIM